MPVLSQENCLNNGNWSQLGFGDVVKSLFFSPKAPTSSGMIWGVGPAFLAPTASEDVPGTEKWAIRPTGVYLFQKDKLTYGMLASHLESFEGDDIHSDVNTTFAQPFVSYGVGGGVTFTSNLEVVYNWEHNQQTIPLNLDAAKVS